jgi:uroporphyrinogen-III synthase
VTAPRIRAGPEPGADPVPLAGYRIGVTAERRREEIAQLLRKRGAQVTVAPAIRLVPLADDQALRASTQACLAEPLDDVVATTGIGFRGWMEAADAWGLGEALRERLASARIYARGPKATGAVRGCGLQEAWTAPSESTHEVVAHLLERGVAGRRIAVQLHGVPVPAQIAALRAAGATPIEVGVYRWDYPADRAPLDRLIRDAAGDRLDAVTFTSALAVDAALARAGDLGLRDDLVAAFRQGRPWACCVGEVTAGALAAEGVPTITPGRARLGDLMRAVSVEVPARNDLVVDLAGRELRLRRDGVLVDGAYVPLAGTPMVILRELAARPGRVVDRRRLLDLLPDGDNDNALETAIARLRARLPARDLVQTVIKRGYRLAAAP